MDESDSPQTVQMPQPVAWAALRDNGSVYACHESREMVEAVSRDGMQIVPLYREPAITDRERDAMEFFADLPWARESDNAAEAAAIRGFLDRHSAQAERLRLTDAEREAVACAAESYSENDDDEECAAIAATLRGLLERARHTT